MVRSLGSQGDHTMFTTFNSTAARAVLGTVGTALCAGICLVAATAPAGAEPSAPRRSAMPTSTSATPPGRAMLDRRIIAAAHAVCVEQRQRRATRRWTRSTASVTLLTAPRPKVYRAAADRRAVSQPVIEPPVRPVALPADRPFASRLAAEEEGPTIRRGGGDARDDTGGGARGDRR